ncbi:ferritin-like domain-containing protein [Halorientalis sp.]|uniref:ferritin-like domain-containing protein n=1 Tax=Halorientalis sp. TaxID=1931229 RepID=UPI0026104D50|nr:ferritin-like domain-containing protein [Halorientalis sp.]
MSVQQPVSSDHQLTRLLQIGIVLEEVVEVRAGEHARTMDAADPELETLLDEAARESADHREQLENLIDDLEADTIPLEEVKGLVKARYESEADFDGVLYDQLCNEETAYKFYDDLITAIEESNATLSVDRRELIQTLAAIRADEADGVEEVAALMEKRE